MSLIEFNCPSCNTTLSVPPEAADATGPCPTCGDIIKGPGLPPAPDAIPDLSGATTSPSQESPKKEELVVPPTASPSQPASGNNSRIGPGVVAIIALLFLGVGLLFGFMAGKQAKIPTKPLSGNSDSPKLGEGEPSNSLEDSPEDLIEQLPPKESEDTSETAEQEETVNAAKATLMAFLSAPDWSSRLVYVLHPDQVAPKMEAVAKTNGDGPISYNEIMAVGLGREDAEVFGVTSEKFPEGIPIAMKKVEDQWLVDWAAYAEFYYDGFRLFAESASGYEGIFRVQVAPIEDKPEHYPLSAPTAGKSYEGRIQPDSSAEEQIQSVMNFYKENSVEQFEAAMAQGGVNFMLKLSRQDIDNKPVIYIEDVVAVGWAPREIEDN